MKKNYVTPVVEVAELETEALMLTASSETGNAGTGSGSAGSGPDLSNEHRGSWGDLWGGE